MECSPEESKDKICPIVNGTVYCQGEGCMAWRRICSLTGRCGLIRKDAR